MHGAIGPTTKGSADANQPGVGERTIYRRGAARVDDRPLRSRAERPVLASGACKPEEFGCVDWYVYRATTGSGCEL